MPGAAFLAHIESVSPVSYQHLAGSVLFSNLFSTRKTIEVVIDQPILITQRVSRTQSDELLSLALSAQDRNKLRGLQTTTCGRNVLLQLPRAGPLLPGEILAGEDFIPLIKVQAAIEELIEVEANSFLELAQAAYHLGNRHVEIELQDKKLFLLKDPVLERMLSSRGLNLKIIKKAFYPEVGAYSNAHNHHSHQ